MRAMVFVDGENMVCRYQAMVKKGFIPNTDIEYEPDVFVWHVNTTIHIQNYHIIRATYYTYVVGDSDRVLALRDRIGSLRFNQLVVPKVASTLSPEVFKKPAKSAEAKGVDIKLTVDLLSHAFRDNADIFHIVAGDGDYVPLIQEVRRYGKTVVLSAFSLGLNPELRTQVDHFHLLDHVFFPGGCPSR